MFTCAMSDFSMFSLLGPSGLTVDDHDPMEDKVYYNTSYLYYQLHIFIIV